jgi:hypothetical protein
MDRVVGAGQDGQEFRLVSGSSRATAMRKIMIRNRRTVIRLMVGCLLPLAACDSEEATRQDVPVALDLAQAERLAELPLGCIQEPFPYKPGHVLGRPEDLAHPQVHHPSFYGCFDWHSAVHGHWSLVYLLKRIPELPQAERAREMISANLTSENIAVEVAYFEMNRWTSSFERTYGWAWLLKLAEELGTWEDEDAARWLANLQPLVDLVCEKYIEYLPKLVYPIRVGEHTNTAFGLSFAYDYAVSAGHEDLREMIASRARDFYSADEGCPLDWEPSGYDFLSPCLQELDLMRKVLDDAEFDSWLGRFLPSLPGGTLAIEPGQVIDRSDGKLVHLDGLNFSRAWCLYPLAAQSPGVQAVADEHFVHSAEKIFDGDYSGEHWLASFALYALKTMDESSGR